jgi:hypothetical protein
LHLIGDDGLYPLAGRHESDDGTDADDYAQHSQAGAQLVHGQGTQSDIDAL